MPMNEYGYDLEDDDTIDEIFYEWEELETCWKKVVKSPEGIPYLITWQRGSTEYQECDPEYKMTKMKPVQKTITTYVVDKE